MWQIAGILTVSLNWLNWPGWLDWMDWFDLPDGFGLFDRLV